MIKTILQVGCSATIFRNNYQEVLLTRRADNGQWCLPGGGLDVGESISECCEREVEEETGLIVRIVRLTGVYSNKNDLLHYPDGNIVQAISMNFDCRAVGGELMKKTQEATDIQWFKVSDAIEMEPFHKHGRRIREAIIDMPSVFLH